jgi:hypothetical protein
VNIALAVEEQRGKIEVEPWEHGEDDTDDGSDHERDG